MKTENTEETSEITADGCLEFVDRKRVTPEDGADASCVQFLVSGQENFKKEFTVSPKWDELRQISEETLVTFDRVLGQRF